MPKFMKQYRCEKGQDINGIESGRFSSSSPRVDDENYEENEGEMQANGNSKDADASLGDCARSSDTGPEGDMPSSRYHSRKCVFRDKADVVWAIGCTLMPITANNLAVKIRNMPGIWQGSPATRPTPCPFRMHASKARNHTFGPNSFHKLPRRKPNARYNPRQGSLI